MTDALADPEQKGVIKAQAFESALKGIAAGSMKYEGDPLLPLFSNEVQNRTGAY